MEISFNDFVRFLIVILHKRGVNLLSFPGDAWHFLFYKIKKSEEFSRSDFFQRMRFDWDGHIPKTPELSEFFLALCVVGIPVYANSRYDENYKLPNGLVELWDEQLGQEEESTRLFLNKVADVAERRFKELYWVENSIW